jgi:hypothetical protein
VSSGVGKNPHAGHANGLQRSLQGNDGRRDIAEVGVYERESPLDKPDGHPSRRAIECRFVLSRIPTVCYLNIFISLAHHVSRSVFEIGSE